MIKLAFGCGLLLTVFLVAPATADDASETRDAKVGEIVLSVPADWVQQEPSRRLRLGQFQVPAVEGDKEPAEVLIFNFGSGGSAQQQVDRWKGQFHEEGRKFTAKSGESPLGGYVLVDLAGTYKQSVGPPILRRTKDVPNSRMLVVMLAVKNKGIYFIKLVGPQDTVTANVDAFRKTFGGQADHEKPFENDAS